MLQALGAIVKKAFEEKTDPEVIAQEAGKIDPSLGEMVRAISRSKSLYLTGLLLIILMVKSCNLNINLDINQLIDQVRDVAPRTIALEETDSSHESFPEE